MLFLFFFFQAEDGIRDYKVTGVQTCALPICGHRRGRQPGHRSGYLQAAARSLPVRVAEGLPRRAHGARHPPGRHAPLQGPLGGARRDPQAARRPRAPVRARRRYARYLRQIPAPKPGRNQKSRPMISFETHPGRYSHWKLSLEGPVATLSLDVAEDKPLVPGYKLKLNSYDLGVDIELHDALNRIRFEHPEVKARSEEHTSELQSPCNLVCRLLLEKKK